MGLRNIASWRDLWRKLEASAKVRTHTFVILLVFLATLAAFGYYANSVRNTVHKDINTAFQQQLNALSTTTESRLQLYESLIRGGAGLTVVHKTLDQADWQTYFHSYYATNKFPEIDGIAFDHYLTSDQVPAYLQEIHAQGQTNFAITPSGSRAVYVPNTYLARYTGVISRSVGYDGYTNPVRRAAMLAAARSGEPAMSGEVRLRANPDTPAFIIYLPVYNTASPLTTPAERQADLYGFVSLAVDINKFLGILLKQTPNANFGLIWNDSQAPHNAPPVYQTNNYASLNKQPNHVTQSIPFTLYQHKWEITATAGPGVVTTAERDRPFTTMFWGLLVSIILAGVVWLLISSREFLLARQKQQEVQSAKDDLLSLASHQLRTPATVVKQYVGMLLQGYGGKLTDKQDGMLRHAYDSNERQLQIINQLLYVARLDAGRITLHKERTDMRKLLEQVCHEQLVEAKLHHQKLIAAPITQALFADVDPQYFHMVIDNLISNAIKYTPEKGTITVKARTTGDEILVSVTDTGIGIDEERQEIIFDKFTRLENELAADVSGSGIGLYLTDQIVNLHGGHIEVQSTPGNGSTFTVHLPIGIEEEKPGTP